MPSVRASEVISRPPQCYLQFYEAWESFLVWAGVWAGGVGEEGSGAEKCFVVQAPPPPSLSLREGGMY